MSGPTRLPYRYINATLIVGGVNMLAGGSDLTLFEAEGIRAFLTNHADHHLQTTDLGIAVANIRLDAIFGSGALVGTLDEKIAAQLERIRSDRAATIAENQAVLIFEGRGEEGVDLASLQEYPRFLTALNGTQRGVFSRRYADALDSIKAAISIEVATLDHLQPLTDGAFFEWPDGRPLFSATLSLSGGRAIVAQSADTATALRIDRRRLALELVSTPRKSRRLLVRMSEETSDRLRQFIFGWTALEIFVTQVFDATDLSRLRSIVEDPNSLVMARLRIYRQPQVINKFGLLAKLIVIAGVLFPAEPEADQITLIDAFKRVQDARNELLHNDGISEDALPIGELQGLHRWLTRPGG